MSFVVSGIGAIATKGNLVVVFDHPEFQIVRGHEDRGHHERGLDDDRRSRSLAAILLSRTTFGRYVYATGGNAEAARLGGVRINTVRVATFALSGMAAALAGTLDASRVLSAQASAGQLPDVHRPHRDHRRRHEHPGRRGLGPADRRRMPVRGARRERLQPARPRPVLPAGHARHHPPARGRDGRLVPAAGLTT